LGILDLFTNDINGKDLIENKNDTDLTKTRNIYMAAISTNMNNKNSNIVEESIFGSNSINIKSKISEKVYSAKDSKKLSKLKKKLKYNKRLKKLNEKYLMDIMLTREIQELNQNQEVYQDDDDENDNDYIGRKSNRLRRNKSINTKSSSWLNDHKAAWRAESKLERRQASRIKMKHLTDINNFLLDSKNDEIIGIDLNDEGRDFDDCDIYIDSY